MWTEQTVRRDLPNVPVKLGRKIVIAAVRGRLNDFASVRLPGDERSHEFAFETIAHALNSGAPLYL